MRRDEQSGRRQKKTERQKENGRKNKPANKITSSLNNAIISQSFSRSRVVETKPNVFMEERYFESIPRAAYGILLSPHPFSSIQTSGVVRCRPRARPGTWRANAPAPREIETGSEKRKKKVDDCELIVQKAAERSQQKQKRCVHKHTHRHTTFATLIASFNEQPEHWWRGH